MTSPNNSPDDPQPTDRPNLFGRPARKVSRAPVTRLTGKNALNPTVVTIFGAGISGLTAAHELVERGCRVYVVEAETDPEWPGQCLVGGMAASQYGRVRAGVEALHPDLLDSANSPSPEIDAWLLELFLMNRTDWIQTNPPVILPAVRFLPDQGNSWPIGSRPLTYSYYSGAAGPPDLAKVVRELKAQRRTQWIWDLVWRNYYTGHAATQEERGPTNVLPNLKQDRKDMEDVCSDLYARLIDDRLLQEVTSESADELLQSQNPLTKELGGWKQDIDTWTEALRASGCELDEDDLRIATCLARTQTDVAQEGDKMISMRWVLQQLEEPKKTAAYRRMLSALGREFLSVQAIPCWCPPDADLAAQTCDSGTSLPQLQQDAARQLRELENELQSQMNAEKLETCFDFTFPPRTFTREGAAKRDRKCGDVWIELAIVEERPPGEHGYRFFPSFYRHLDDTMSRIPLDDGGQTVADNLKATVVQGLGVGKDDGLPQHKKMLIELSRSPPTSLTELWDNTIGFVKTIGGTIKDAALFNVKIVEFLTTSTERRRDKYQKITWREFIELDRFSPAMQRQLAAAAQVLLAFSVAEADAYSYGNVAVQLLLDNVVNTGQVNRTLNGPTTEAFLKPWQTYLEREGVTFIPGRLGGFDKVDAEPPVLLPRVEFFSEATKHEYSDAIRNADFYVLALSAPATQKLVSQAAERVDPAVLATRAPDFAKFLRFWSESGFDDRSQMLIAKTENGPLRHMTGMQFYFDSKTRVGQGHVYYPFSEWGLSTISQSEFWRRRLAFTDGYLGVLSIDLCSLSGQVKLGGSPGAPLTADFAGVLTAGRDPRESKFLTALEVWRQLERRIVPVTGPDSPPGDINRSGIEFPLFFHVDDGITKTDEGWINKTPFMATTPASWITRPGFAVDPEDGRIEYALNFDRWLLCGTFAATHTRLTTMEAANESARHAVRAILVALSKPNADPAGDPPWRPIQLIDGGPKQYAYFGEQALYDGASAWRVYDFPPVFPLEDREPEDLGPLKRLDKALFDRGLPHAMEILRVPDRIDLAFLAHDLSADTRGLFSLPKDANSNKPAFPFLEANWDLLKEQNKQWRDLFGREDLSAGLKNAARRLIEYLRRLDPEAAGAAKAAPP